MAIPNVDLDVQKELKTLLNISLPKHDGFHLMDILEELEVFSTLNLK